MATDKKRAIIAAALELFAQRGYSDTPTSAIAKAAGVAEGTIFHHFHSKNGILLTILKDVSDHFFREVEPVLCECQTGFDCVTSLVDFHFRFADRREAELFLILRDLPAVIASAPGILPGANHETIVSMKALYLNAVKQGVADGTISTPNPEATAAVILGMVIGITRQQLFGGLSREDVLSFRAEVLRFVHCALMSAS